PKWARTGPEDDDVAGKYAYARPFPELLEVGDNARCRCGASAGPSIPIEEHDCVIYDHIGAARAKIQVRRCPECPPKSRMTAGPDLGDLGLFNMNNQTLISHALLNKYDTMLSSNETTYHGFAQTLEREYESYGSELPFMGPDRFRTCWFAFMNVQPCKDDFTCSICGPEPEVVVVDGVTVCFHKRRRTAKLKPPTYISRSSPIHEDVKRPKR
ncbi:hypothetical protein AURDEDRAFT_29323, partial [Auricularia subglabra TFB-10046 SS5]